MGECMYVAYLYKHASRENMYLSRMYINVIRRNINIIACPKYTHMRAFVPEFQRHDSCAHISLKRRCEADARFGAAARARAHICTHVSAVPARVCLYGEARAKRGNALRNSISPPCQLLA